MSYRLLFTGDVRIDGAYQNGVRSLFALFPDFDLYVINFESGVAVDSGSSVAKKSVPIVASFQELEHLLLCIEPDKLLLNFANNHSRDSGSANLVRAKSMLRNRGSHIIDSEESVDVVVNDELVVFSAFGHDSWKNAANHLSIAKDSRNIVLMHWGEEFVFHASPDQRSVAKSLSQLGVDLIVGNHPHVIQGCDNYDDCHVYYSLGNTVFGFPGMPAEGRLGSVLALTHEASSEHSTLIPLITNHQCEVERLAPAAHIFFNQFYVRLNKSIARNTSMWYREAAAPFFRNHLGSWLIRIRTYGLFELIRFLKACCSLRYLNMFFGLICGRIIVTERHELSFLLRQILKLGVNKERVSNKFVKGNVN